MQSWCIYVYNILFVSCYVMFAHVYSPHSTYWLSVYCLCNSNNTKLVCGTRYHHPRRLQCVLSRNMRIFKVAMWHYRRRHNLKNNNYHIWDNLQCCLLVPRSPSKPVMLTFDLQSWKCYSLRSSFGMYDLEIQLWYWHLLMRHCPCNLLPVPTSPKHEYRKKLWGHPVTSPMTSSP